MRKILEKVEEILEKAGVNFILVVKKGNEQHVIGSTNASESEILGDLMSLRNKYKSTLKGE